MKNLLIAQADAARLPLPDQSVDLVIGSPPYLDARTYLEDGRNIGIARKCAAWVDFMLAVTAEACRVSRGLVLWVCAGKTQNWCYQPGPEGLLWEWWKRGGQAWRPCYWHRVGIPGSGGKQWYRADVEYVLAFKGAAGKVPWSDNTANGHAPKWGPGGEMSNRLGSGARVNQWGKNGSPRGMGNRNENGEPYNAVRPSHVTTIGRTVNQWGHSYASGGTAGSDDAMTCGAPRRSHTKSRADGTDAIQHHGVPTLANPGTLLKVNAGGGMLGHPDAHKNEAPYPVKVPAFFIRSHCPPGGIVLDPFGGSGSTAQAAREEGRRPLSFDLRFSQCALSRTRLSTPGKVSRPKQRLAAEVIGGLFA